MGIKKYDFNSPEHQGAIDTSRDVYAASRLLDMASASAQEAIWSGFAKKSKWHKLMIDELKQARAAIDAIIEAG